MDSKSNIENGTYFLRGYVTVHKFMPRLVHHNWGEPWLCRPMAMDYDCDSACSGDAQSVGVDSRE